MGHVSAGQAHRAADVLVRYAWVVDAYFEATMFMSETSQRLFRRYSDSLVESDGDLRIAHKRIMVDRVMDLPVTSKEFVPY
ncbi:hypothetical protein [Rhodococcus marinonascens]|uniref:hypothetical protein n=1 Tax=Rhodococcus marinonascens TaxID=38311 RepID=UPI0009336C29|nr:hypothetical protein [Rhodococcus marinonascens]